MDVEALVEAPFVKQQQQQHNGHAPDARSPPRERCVATVPFYSLVFMTDANAAPLQASIADPLRRPSLTVASVRVLAPLVVPPAAQAPP
jgi:hypothetical protein